MWSRWREPKAASKNSTTRSEKDGGSATLVPLNLTDFDGIARLGAALHERHGKLDILVGNAGIAGPSSPLGHIELKPWNDVMAVNVTANFQLIRCMEPLLRKSDAGRAVFVTSAASNKAPAYLGPYAASKAALETLVRVWANETASTPIRVNLFNPGPIRTRMRATVFPGEDPRDARHAGAGRRIDRADVRAGVERDRQVLRLPDPHADEFSRAGVTPAGEGNVYRVLRTRCSRVSMPHTGYGSATPPSRHRQHPRCNHQRQHQQHRGQQERRARQFHRRLGADEIAQRSA